MPKINIPWNLHRLRVHNCNIYSHTTKKLYLNKNIVSHAIKLKTLTSKTKSISHCFQYTHIYYNQRGVKFHKGCTDNVHTHIFTHINTHESVQSQHACNMTRRLGRMWDITLANRSDKGFLICPLRETGWLVTNPPLFSFCSVNNMSAHDLRCDAFLPI